MQRIRLGAIAAALAGLLPSALAQGTVWTVGPSASGADFAQLQDAVDAAADGDVLLVKTGDYAATTVDGKALSILADTGAAVDVAELAVRNLAADQDFFGRGLALGAPANRAASLRLDSNLGEVMLEDCSSSGAPSQDGAHLENNASVVFVRCAFFGADGTNSTFFDVTPAGNGLSSVGSAVSMYLSTAHGGDGYSTIMHQLFDAGNGGAGLVSTSTVRLLVAGSTFEGGLGGSNTQPPFQCSFDAGDGGPGLSVFPPGFTSFRLDSNFAGGAAGFPGLCVPGFEGSAGQPVVGFVQPLSDTLRTMQADSPVREGEFSTSTYTGDPGDLVFGFWGIEQKHVFFDIFKGTSVPDPLASVFLGAIPAGGVLTFSLPLGDLPPGFDSLSLFSQAAIIPSDDTLIFTNATGVVILDAGF